MTLSWQRPHRDYTENFSVIAYGAADAFGRTIHRPERTSLA